MAEMTFDLMVIYNGHSYRVIAPKHWNEADVNRILTGMLVSLWAGKGPIPDGTLGIPLEIGKPRRSWWQPWR